ncbi:MAG: hypothetical protein GX222_00745 [Ruminococcaceae bacterium]|mgnify:CR=1 FL=1|nr:hypothetical protein [Oscillospiraceae bacterium]
METGTVGGNGKLLKVTGIIMIVFGSIGIIFGLLAVVGAGAVAALVGGSAAGLVFAAILSLLGSILQLVAGIMGAKNKNIPANGKKCFTLGIIVILLAVAGNVMTVALGGEFSVLGLALGAVLPVLYIVGALQLKKSA